MLALVLANTRRPRWDIESRVFFCSGVLHGKSADFPPKNVKARSHCSYECKEDEKSKEFLPSV